MDILQNLGNYNFNHFVREIIDLEIKLGQALIGLSGAAIIGSIVLGIRYKKVWPYIYTAVAGSCYLIYGAIVGSFQQTTTSLKSLGVTQLESRLAELAEPLVSKLIAAIFFLAIFAPVAWILLFDTFRAAASSKQGGTTLFGLKFVPSLAGTYFGYFWAFIDIIVAIAYSGSLGKVLSESKVSVETVRNIYQCSQFIVYGLWAFIAPLLVQLYLSRRDLRRIIPTFGLYILFLFLMTVGYSVSLENPITFSGVKSNRIASFVLGQVFGVLALFVAILAGHSWASTVSDERIADEHQLKTTV